MQSINNFGKNDKREEKPSFTGSVDGYPYATEYGIGIPVSCDGSDSVFRCLVIPTNTLILTQIQFGDSLLMTDYRVYKPGHCPTIVATVQLNLPNDQSVGQLRLC